MLCCGKNALASLPPLQTAQSESSGEGQGVGFVRPSRKMKMRERPIKRHDERERENNPEQTELEKIQP